MSDVDAPASDIWVGVSASVRGASHVRTGLVNQDAVQIAPAPAGSTCSVAAVADGHGGARYVRSDVGARMAVSIACQLGLEAGRLLGRTASPTSIEAHLQQRLIPDVVGRWQAAILEHAAANPFTAAESHVASAPLGTDDPLIAYGCTVLVALVATEWVALVQIGDGDVITVDRDGTVRAPVPGDDRLVGGETTSLCLPTATDDARIAVLGNDAELVLLATDGYGNSFASDDWMQEIGSGFASLIAANGLASIAERLPAWLAESAEASGDDVTAALMTRSTAGPERPAANVGDRELAPGGTALLSVRDTPGGSAGRAAPADDVLSTGGRPRRSWRGPAAAALIAAVVGLGVGWLAADARTSPTASAGTDGSTSTSSSTIPTSSSTTTPQGEQPEQATSPSDPAAESQIEKITIVAPSLFVSQIIEFSPDANSPDPVSLGSVTGPVPTTQLYAGRAVWSIDGNGRLLRRTSAEGATRTVVRDVAVGGMTASGDHVWIISADGTQLRAVDLDGQPVGAWTNVVPGDTGPFEQVANPGQSGQGERG